ncbi:hypothetical protein SNE40_008642 [Patella caerulea]|uniref:BRCT domain-containing protein n=1 Tax=Patella caerulea TaxID=87958 RepID=A0AAN8JML2_PATCE
MSEVEVMRCVQSTDENSTPGLQEAYEALCSHGFKTEWTTPDECLQIDEKVRTIAFVFDPFEGAAFVHLANLGFRILGPQCVLSCLLMKIDIPRNGCPVYNLAMKNLTVSCTSIDKQMRDEIHHRVQLMGGSISRDFTEHVTHLISGEVGSKKYQVAAALKKEIMSPEWVQAVWEKSRSRHVHASDDQFSKYRCPLFKGFCISVSGLPQDERKEIRKLIESEGGIYSGEMKMNSCTHLVINEPKGTKYEFAIKWNIHTVSSKWIYVSIEKGYCEKEEDYFTDSERSPSDNRTNRSSHATSTPTKDICKIQESHLGDISAISNSSIMAGGHQVNESTALQMSRRVSVVDQSRISLDVDLNKTTSVLFLDGLKIYLSGFRNPSLDKLRKIINAGGATRFNSINEGVTHVIIGEPIESDLNLLTSGEYRPFPVTAQWLVDCFKMEKHLDESNYLCLNLPAPQPNSPQVKNKSKSKTTKSSHESTLQAAAVNFQDDMEMDDILSQYLPNQNNNHKEETIQEAEIEPDLQLEPEVETQDESTFVEGKIFSGKKFIFLGFDEGEQSSLYEFVVERGGKIIPQNKRKVADYGVVPVFGYPVTVAVQEVVTYAWVQMCIEEDQLFDIDSNTLFRPMDIIDETKPLKGCVISVSGFSGTQRGCITDLAEILGAICQDYFMKNASKGHLKCSHLVVNEPKGSKYAASVKWNIPAVDKEWVFSCAQSGKRLPEENFLIETFSRTVQKPRKEPQATIIKPPNNIQISEAEQAPASSKDPPVKKQAPETISSKETPEPTSSKEPPAEKQAHEPACSKESAAKRLAREPTSSKEPPAKKHISDPAMTNGPSAKKHISDPAISDGDSDEIIFKGHNSEKQTKVSNEKINVQSSNDEKALRSSGEGEEKVPSSSAEEVRCNVANPMEGIVDRVRSRALQDNQLVNVRQEQTDSPQIKPKHSRLQELKNPNTPGPGTPTMDTPSKFMKPGIDFNPNYSFTDLMKKYQSPENRRDSFDELCSQTLKAAVEKSAIPVDRCPTPLVSRKESIVPAVVRPLSGVTIYVSKKLSAKISQFHDIVSELGGDYQWKYTPSCTHVIFQGRANDVNKEFRKARDENKFIVSPHWLQACQEQQVKVQESLFPHNYNPKLSLNVMSKSTPRATPVRPARQAVRSTRSNNSQSTSPKPVPKLNLNMLSDAMSGTDNKTSSESERDARKDGDQSKKEKTGSEKDETKNSTDTDRSPVVGRENNKLKSSSGSDSNKDRISNDVDDKLEEVEKDSGGTLEMRMAISKQLDDMMASAKSKKPTKRKSLKRLNSSGQLNSSDSRPSSRQETWDKNPDKRKTRSTGKTNEEFSGPTESQSVLVTWDDPVGRLEKEKLAAKLEQACSPTQTQNTDDCMAGLDMPQDAQYSDVEDRANTSSDSDTRKHDSPRDTRTHTPEAPSLAFPINRKSVAIKSPEPVELIEDDHHHDDDDLQTPRYIFLLSGMTNEERVDYGALIEQLGGKFVDGQNYDSAATHLVTGCPGRNEKFLACVAAGKWILHKSYFEACRQQHKFVQEELYEWGGESTRSLPGITKTVLNLAMAANTWRQKIQEMTKSQEKGGAFLGWKVILHTDKKKESNFIRLLVAGGAQVIPVKPPYTPDISATHAFLELRKLPLEQGDLECLLRADVLCLKPEFIPVHLTDPTGSPDDYIPTEILALKASLPDSMTSKRKFSSSNASNKRSRKQ